MGCLLPFTPGHVHSECHEAFQKKFAKPNGLAPAVVASKRSSIF